MQESAFLINGLTMEVVDEEDGKDNIFFYENGLVSFIEFIKQMNLEKSRELEELFYYHCLNIGNAYGYEGDFSSNAFKVLFMLLNGEYKEAENYLSNTKERSNDIYGCRIILYLLKNDRMGVDFWFEKRNYEKVGIIGILVKILNYYSQYETSSPNLLLKEFSEIKLFPQFPLIKALIELNDSLNRRGVLSKNSYNLLRELTPLAAIHYCYGLDDENAKEKVISFVHRGFDSDEELKILENECKSKFANDILIKELDVNRTEKIFDIYEYFLEGEKNNGRNQ